MTAARRGAARTQLQFLRQAALLEESTAPYFVRRTGFVLSLLVWAFLAWSATTQIEEVAQAPGEVVPNGFTQIVQHYDGGILKSIKVKEGSFVNEGDTLLMLDGAGAQEDLNRAIVAKRGIERDIEVARELYTLQQDMMKRGIVPKPKYLEAKKALLRAQNEFEQQQEVIARLKDRVSRLEIRAPVSGIVKGLKVNTIGEVIKSGDALMEILPVGEALVVEARISTSDIGHVAVGQPVKVKVSSYDFSRFGVVEGTLRFITATTFTGETGEKYYRGRVELAQKHVGDRSDLEILPGMTVQAGIVTGHKTILEYLLKPFQRALEDGLSER